MKRFRIFISFLMLIQIISACTRFDKELEFKQIFSNEDLSELTLSSNYSSRNKALYYETLSIVIKNNSSTVIEILNSGSIYFMEYSSQSKIWKDLDIGDLKFVSQDDNSFPIILQPGMETIIFILPKIFNEEPSKIRLVVEGSSMQNEIMKKSVGYLDITLYPFQGINPDALLIKHLMPELQKKAEKWQEDAYISEIHLYIPSQWAPNGNVSKIIFQSKNIIYEEFSFNIDNSGLISEQYITYSNGVTKKNPILDDLWLLDGLEIMQILIAYDSSITIPSANCEGISLGYNLVGDLEWVYHLSDCKLSLVEKYKINPTTGEVMLIQSK